MNNTEKAKELISKHLYLHGGDGLAITNGAVYCAVLDAICEALTEREMLEILFKDCEENHKRICEFLKKNV